MSQDDSKKAQDDLRISVPRESESSKLTLDEITVDVSAFLQFLLDQSETEDQGELASFWMLIPKAIKVDWREGVELPFLEKEIFSRTIYVVASPVEKEFREKRNAELLKSFESVITEDQTSQIILFVQKLKADERKKIVQAYIYHKDKVAQKKSEKQDV